ncbi:MAG: hypothetical protein ACTSWN_00790 [Promethearchaeota archaeon]
MDQGRSSVADGRGEGMQESRKDVWRKSLHELAGVVRLGFFTDEYGRLV